MDVYGIQLRQPLAWDLIGRKVAIAALGTAGPARARDLCDPATQIGALERAIA